MTAAQMLTEALNGALRRPIVGGAELRQELIRRGIVQPNGWHLATITRTRTAINGTTFEVKERVLVQ